MKNRIFVLVIVTVCIMCSSCGSKNNVVSNDENITIEVMSDKDFLEMYCNTFFTLKNTENSVYSCADTIADEWGDLTSSEVLLLVIDLQENNNLHMKVIQGAEYSQKVIAENLMTMCEHDKKYDELYNQLKDAYTKYLELYTLYKSPTNDNDSKAYKDDIDSIDNELGKQFGVIEGLYPGEMIYKEKFIDRLTEEQKKEYEASNQN